MLKWNKDSRGQFIKLPQFVTIIYSEYLPENTTHNFSRLILMTLNNDLILEQWTLSSYKKKQVMENNLIKITTLCINQVTINNELH
jgi:hypothetical protein